MSILVNDMEMPKTCRKCGFYHHSVDDGYYDFEYCGANNKEFNNAYDSTKPHINPFEEKLSTCPLCSVPPHGRLIDADKMRESIRRQAGLLKLMGGEFAKIAETLEKGFLQEIDNAPTIIPAEGVSE